MLEGIMIGLGTAFSPANLLMVVGGCLIGTFIGMLPGLGPISAIAHDDPDRDFLSASIRRRPG